MCIRDRPRGYLKNPQHCLILPGHPRTILGLSLKPVSYTHLVGILTQYQPLVLNEYIGNGQPWDLDRLHGGVHVLPPYQQASGSDWYKGTDVYKRQSICSRIFASTRVSPRVLK